MSKTVLWFVSAAYRRYEITRLCLAQRRELCDELAAHGIEAHGVIVADDENLDLARDYGFHALDRPNTVGRKVNDGIEYACREGGADYVAPVGSDDWMLASYVSQLPTERNLVHTSARLAIVSPDARQIAHVRPSTTDGYIPWLIPRRLLERCGFRPASDTRDRGIDGSIASGLRRRNPGLYITQLDVHPLQVVDFKSATVQVTDYAKLRRRKLFVREQRDPFRALAEAYPRSLVRQARLAYNR